jgi:hydroxymethylglutaryl-CoA reductase
MSLHARSVATAAGASGEEVNRVASELAASGAYDLAAAQRILRTLRGTG